MAFSSEGGGPLNPKKLQSIQLKSLSDTWIWQFADKKQKL